MGLPPISAFQISGTSGVGHYTYLRVLGDSSFGDVRAWLGGRSLMQNHPSLGISLFPSLPHRTLLLGSGFLGEMRGGTRGCLQSLLVLSEPIPE